MSDSRTLSLYVHRCKAQEREIDRLHAALRLQRELLATYADGWRANYDECGRCQEAPPADLVRQLEEYKIHAREMDSEAARLGCMIGQRDAEIAALRQEVAACERQNSRLLEEGVALIKELDDWKIEGITLRDQCAELSAQLRLLQAGGIDDAEWVTTGSEEGHRDG